MTNMSYKIGMILGALIVIGVIVILVTSFVRGWNKQSSETTEGFASEGSSTEGLDSILQDARDAETKLHSLIRKMEKTQTNHTALSKRGGTKKQKEIDENEENEDDEDDDDDEEEGFREHYYTETYPTKTEQNKEDETEYVSGVSSTNSVQEFAPVM